MPPETYTVTMILLPFIIVAHAVHHLPYFMT